MTIHLKMTGQLFVVPADVPVDPYVRLVLELGRRARAAVPRHPQVRQGRVIRARPRDRRPRHRGRWRVALCRDRPRAARGDEFTLREVPAVVCAGGRADSSRCSSTSRSSPGIGNIYADESLWRFEGAPAAHGRLRSGRPTSAISTRRSAPSWVRRSSVAGRSIDDYTGPGRRRLDAQRPRRLPTHRRALPPLRPADQAHRGSVPDRRTSARGASASRQATERARATILRSMIAAARCATAAAGPSSTVMDRSEGLARRPSRARELATREARTARTKRRRRRAGAPRPGRRWATSPRRPRRAG